MILITSEEGDISCIKVSEWLLSFNSEVIVLDERSKIISIKIENIGNSNEEINIYGKDFSFSFNKIKSYWYRRSSFHMSIDIEPTYYFLKDHLESEINSIITYLHQSLNTLISIGSPLQSSFNKLFCLKMASKVGLLVPKSFISNEPNSLKQFLKNRSTITKGISETITCIDFNENVKYFSYTSDIEESNIEDTGLYFPCFIQEKIQKLFEIRVFYLDEKFWSIAIFSQTNDKTKTDFRRYDLDKPNRMVPYELPNEIKVKIISLMNLLNLNTGSIDLIYTINGEFVFLEINPDGQFDFVSGIGNYNIEQYIAKYLIYGK